MEENTSPQRNETLAWILFAVFLLLCIMRMVAVIRMYDLFSAKQALFTSSFGIEMTLIILYSIVFVIYMPEEGRPPLVIAPVMKNLLGYYIVRFCFMLIIGSFLFAALLRLFLLYLPFSGFLYAGALVLTIVMSMSLLRMASKYYFWYRIKKISRK
ncbi:MAG: hypothetical protein ACOYMZ_02420 [Minisyncoccia bacterium]